MFGKKKAKNPPLSTSVVTVNEEEELEVLKTDWSKFEATHIGPRPNGEVPRYLIPPTVKTVTMAGYSFQRQLNKIIVRNPMGSFSGKIREFPDYIPSSKIAGQSFIYKSAVVNKLDIQLQQFLPGLLTLDKGYKGDTRTLTGNIYTADFMYPNSEDYPGLDDLDHKRHLALRINRKNAKQMWERATFYVRFESEGNVQKSEFDTHKKRKVHGNVRRSIIV